MASSPRMSRFSRQTELEMERSTPRVGLSDYTTQRLAELRASRATQEDDLSSLGLSPRRTGAQPAASQDHTTSPRTRSVLTDSGSTSSTGSSSLVSSQRRPLTQSKPDSDSSSTTTKNGPDTNNSEVTTSQRRRYQKSSPDQESSPRRTFTSIPTSPQDNSDHDSGIGSSTTNGDYKPQRDLNRSNSSVSSRLNNSDNSSASTFSSSSAAGGAISKTASFNSPRSVPNTQTSSTLSSSQSFSVGNSSASSNSQPQSQPTSYGISIGTPGGGSSLNQQLENYRAKKLTEAETVPDSTYSTSSEAAMSAAMSARNKLTHVTPDLTKECKEYKADYTVKSDQGSALGRSNSKVTTDTDDEDSVGFSSLPEQVHRKALKRGFDFTLMVVGESGLGKSTLIQSLFLNTDLYNDRHVPDVQEKLQKTVTIEKKYMEIEERGVKLRLTIVDTPGYNDSLCGEDSWKPVETYIDEQFEQYLKDESGLNRKNIKDNRVHCCLYFISPYGHGLKPLDIHFMKRLHYKVNIMPVIAKADTLTHTELRNLKAHILDQIDNNDIHIYEFPDCDSDEDEEFQKQDQELKAAIPFAVIGSNTIVEISGKRIRGRLYPWGIVEVDNPQHCDFTKLRQMLISTHMQDLKDVTRDCHYENYRAKHISDEMSKQAQRERNIEIYRRMFPSGRASTFLNEMEQANQNSNLQPALVRPDRSSKLKRDSSPNFESIVAADQLLQQKDEQIKQMQQMLVHMQQKLKSSKSPAHGNQKQRVNGLGNL